MPLEPSQPRPRPLPAPVPPAVLPLHPPSDLQAPPPRLLLLLLLLLALAAPTFAGSTTGVTSPEPATTAVLLFDDRPPIRLDSADRDGTRLESARLDAAPADLVAAWVWSDHRPPQRVAADRLAEELARLDGDAGAPPGGRLRVRLAAGTEEPYDDLRVIAGPQALFREVPESWLPRWPVGEDGTVSIPRQASVAWRLRLVGEGRGTGWQDLEGPTRELVAKPSVAGDVDLVVADADGFPLPGAGLTILQDVHGATRPGLLSQHRADERGRLRIPALPADLAASWIASAPPLHAPRALRGRPIDLPRELRLPRGVTVLGRFTDGDDRPLEGVRLRVEGWLDDAVPARFDRRVESAGDGTFRLGPLPPRPLALLASRPGLVAFRRLLEPSPGAEVDLGTVALLPGRDLAVVVRDDGGAPVAGATVSPSTAPGGVGGSGAVTDEAGRALLTGLPDAPLRLLVRADGHLEAEHRIAAPWPEEAALVLTRAFAVHGTYLDESAQPLAGGRIRVEQGPSFRFEEPARDGTFRIELDPGTGLEPGQSYTLRFTSPVSAPRTLEVEPGPPGGSLDLGAVTAPSGVVAWGRVVSAVDGTPVVGARVWTPRPSRDPVGAWIHGDLLETRTDELGHFELGGLDGSPGVLRIEATGFARGHARLQPETGALQLDLGEVELSAGSLLRVHLEGTGDTAEDGALARVDLRQEWRDLDMLVAPVLAGVAELPHVPAGEALLTVLAGEEVVCERTVRVPPEEPEVEVRCRSQAQTVQGLVLAGGEPAGPGFLEWRTTEPAAVAATIFNRSSALGQRQQQVVGRGRPPVRVEVAADGTFTSDRLPPGSWRVTWWSDAGTTTAPRTVEVPEAREARVVVDVGGATLAGTVLDESGLPVAGAWVRQLDGDGVVRSGEEGGFRLHGLAPGRLRLQGRDGNRFTEVAEAWIEEGRPAEPVELVFTTESPGEIVVRVATDRGVPADGAFVFLDTGSRGIQVVSAGPDGTARLTLAAPYPTRARLAAFHAGRWSLGAWQPWEDLRGEVEQQVASSGELLVESTGTHGTVGIEAPEGWDLDRLLALLGTRPAVSPEHPLLLTGLPEGLYRIGGQRTVQVRDDRRERLELD